MASALRTPTLARDPATRGDGTSSSTAWPTVTLVVACDREQGDAWSGAVEAIDGGFGRVAVWRGPGEGPGNEALEARGATRIESIDDLDALLDGRETDGP